MQEPHHCILSRRAEAAPEPPGERETSNVTLNAWTPRLQTLEDVAPDYALEYRFLTALVRLHGAQPSARTGAL
jgi:hypothetical protein